MRFVLFYYDILFWKYLFLNTSLFSDNYFLVNRYQKNYLMNLMRLFLDQFLAFYQKIKITLPEREELID